MQRRHIVLGGLLPDIGRRLMKLAMASVHERGDGGNQEGGDEHLFHGGFPIGQGGRR